MQQQGPSRTNTNEEGYFAYMQRQMQERTQNLSLAGDNIDRLEESSSGFAKDVNKYVQNQKKKAVLGCKWPSRPFKLSSSVEEEYANKHAVVLGSKFGL